MSAVRARFVIFGLFGAVISLGAPRAADANDPDVVMPEGSELTPAVKYAALDQSACDAELSRRGVPYERVESARGVLAPIRFTGPLHGVTYRSILPESKRKDSAWDIVDCRLALALDDFATVLAGYDVKEVVHFSMYRPPPLRAWLEGVLGKRHAGALAIDAGRFVRSDGTSLDVEKDFGGRIGQKTCGPKASAPPHSTEGRALREIVCDAADKHLFNVELTPHYNRAHRNHFHLEVKPGAKWFLIR